MMISGFRFEGSKQPLSFRSMDRQRETHAESVSNWVVSRRAAFIRNVVVAASLLLVTFKALSNVRYWVVCGRSAFG
jgi:hypothetical protein